VSGVPDEYGVLNEGEIFCQWQDPEDRLETPEVVRGHVMVCRAPAMHMGDVRRVKAVDQPRLRHLVNVIVFSVRGKRDLPNMLGGGDLDGDDYTLIWDPRFLIKENSPPMDYTPPEPVRVLQVTMVHLRENFVSYLKNDMLG
jgi:RNA-dependent RNA polymerase